MDKRGALIVLTLLLGEAEDSIGSYRSRETQDLLLDARTAIDLFEDDTTMQEAVSAQMRWIARWSDYCSTCEGRGEWSESFDPSPDRVSLSAGSMRDSGPCEHCVERGICPRCGKKTLKKGSGPCRVCNWNGPQDGLPFLPVMADEYLSQSERRRRF